MNYKPFYPAPGNASTTAVPSGSASGTSGALPSGTGATNSVQTFIGGAERIGRVGWEWSFGVIVIGAVVMGFGF